MGNMGNGKSGGGSCCVTWLFTGLTGLLWSLKATTSQLFKVYEFPISHSYTKSPRIYDHFDIFFLIENLVLAIFPLISIIFLARWCSSSKERITNEGKLNLRLRLISRKKLSTFCYAMTRATTTMHKETRLGGKCQDLFFGNVRRKRSRPIGQNIRHKR